MDEIMDHGYPKISETKILKEFINTGLNKLGGEAIHKDKDNKLFENMTGKISWRTDSIKHTKNEVYHNILEKVNSLVFILNKHRSQRKEFY